MPVKIFNWQIGKITEHSIKISFEIENLNGVDLIISAFNSGKEFLSRDIKKGLTSLLPVFITLYTFIKKGREKE